MLRFRGPESTLAVLRCDMKVATKKALTKILSSGGTDTTRRGGIILTCRWTGKIQGKIGSGVWSTGTEHEAKHNVDASRFPITGKAMSVCVRVIRQPPELLSFPLIHIVWLYRLFSSSEWGKSRFGSGQTFSCQWRSISPSR